MTREELVARYRDDPDYQDDPERGIYWGLVGDHIVRWSRAWYDWRRGG